MGGGWIHSLVILTITGQSPKGTIHNLEGKIILGVSAPEPYQRVAGELVPLLEEAKKTRNSEVKNN